MTVSSENYDRIILVLWNGQASKTITINITQGEGAVIGNFGFGIPAPQDGAYGKLLYLEANSIATISNNSTGCRYDEVQINYIRLN